MKFQQAKNPSSGGRLRPLRGFSRPRLGLTLIEILMTIFVLAIGLLGVAALLPVGTFQMRQGQIAQRSAEIGSGALDTIEASGINHPGRWLANTRAGPPTSPSMRLSIRIGILVAGELKKHPVTEEPLDPEYVRIACPVSGSSNADELSHTCSRIFRPIELAVWWSLSGARIPIYGRSSGAL